MALPRLPVRHQWTAGLHRQHDLRLAIGPTPRPEFHKRSPCFAGIEMRRLRAKTRSGRADQALNSHWLESPRTRKPLPSSALYAWLDVHLSRQGLKRVGLQALPGRIGWHAEPSRPPRTACSAAKNGSLAPKSREPIQWRIRARPSRARNRTHARTTRIPRSSTYPLSSTVGRWTVAGSLWRLGATRSTVSPELEHNRECNQQDGAVRTLALAAGRRHVRLGAPAEARRGGLGAYRGEPEPGLSPGVDRGSPRIVRKRRSVVVWKSVIRH